MGEVHVDVHPCGDWLRQPARTTGVLVDGDPPDAHRPAAIAGEIEFLPIRGPYRSPVERRVVHHLLRYAAGYRQHLDITLSSSVDPVADVRTRRRPSRLLHPAVVT